MGRKKKSDIRDLPKIPINTENPIPIERLHPCDRCGSLMEKTETGHLCPNCNLIEWLQEDGTYTSYMEKCPDCGNVSPNVLLCSYCGYPIDEQLRKWKEEKEQK